jgi:tRNA(Ile)-lysidine synthase
MRIKFLSFIDKHQLVGFGEKFFLAVSGGVDSMVMLNLFHECGYSFSVLHCNFSLRGQESEEDDKLVRKTCKDLQLELFVKRFDTVEYAQLKNISIQVAARELRYGWFSEICKEKGVALVAVAHNRNDIAETMLINLCRGTGLKGLTGIKPKFDVIIRPLLFASRDDIMKYAKEKRIEFRDDTSNTNVKYARNRIRHKVIPELERINAGVVENLYSTSIFLGQAWEAIGERLIKLKEDICKYIDDEIYYSIPMLTKEPLRQIFLVEELVNYGFSTAQVIEIEKSLFSQSGKVFHSNSYRLIRDREYLIVSPILPIEISTIDIFTDTQSIEYPLNMTFAVRSIGKEFEFPKSYSIGVFDIEKITFPITLRLWKKGDSFIPLGMKGRKKVSDFLIDQKVPLHCKEKVYVMESNAEIMWVVGYRIDNRCRVTDKTKRVFMATLVEERT